MFLTQREHFDVKNNTNGIIVNNNSVISFKTLKVNI